MVAKLYKICKLFKERINLVKDSQCKSLGVFCCENHQKNWIIIAYDLKKVVCFRGYNDEKRD